MPGVGCLRYPRRVDVAGVGCLRYPLPSLPAHSTLPHHPTPLLLRPPSAPRPAHSPPDDPTSTHRPTPPAPLQTAVPPIVLAIGFWKLPFVFIASQHVSALRLTRVHRHRIPTSTHTWSSLRHVRSSNQGAANLHFIFSHSEKSCVHGQIYTLSSPPKLPGLLLRPNQRLAPSFT